MKKILSLVNVFLLLLGAQSYGQTISSKTNAAGNTTVNKKGSFQVKWKTNPFDNQVFIENKGQFDGSIKSGEKILYGVQMGYIKIYFTANKIIYRYDKSFFKKAADPHADPDDIENLRHKVSFLTEEWVGADKSVTIIAKDEKANYYTYGSSSKSIEKANIFKKIIYKNLYPGVDAIYQFINGKDGIEYTLIVHPGADLSQIKISYSGAKSIKRNVGGDLIINSDLDVLTEHAPVTSYQDEPGNISFSNVVNGNTESFKANENYDKSKTIVIDPWITDPLFSAPGWDKAYDLDWDYQGNVYAYGGNCTSMLQLVKMNKLGAIQWTYNADSLTPYYGDFCTDKVTGTSYLVEGYGGNGGMALKVNTNGICVGKFPGEPNMRELWRAEFDACNGNIVIGGGGTLGEYQAGVLDSDMSSINPVNVLGASGALHDMSTLTIDPNGNQCYMTSARSQSDPTFADNMVIQLPLPSLSPTIYQVHEQLGFVEVASVPYCGGFGDYNTNAMNGAAASPSWLYLYNGDTLRRYHKNTGAFVSGFPIRQNTPYLYGGLDVDACDDIFVGVQDSIYVLDSTYAIKTKIHMDSTVFDIHLGESGALYACGVGFVTQMVNPVTPNLISSASGTPSSCSACNGTATVNINCGIAPYAFKWSDGNTNETDTGLCPGVYTVTVTDAACPPHTQTALVPVTGENGFSASITDSNPNCGFRKGNATIHVSGGFPPYKFQWSNGSTNQNDTGLVAGTYICIVTDNSGCKYEVGVTLINPTAPRLYTSPAKDSLCLGNSIPINITGAKTYVWSPSQGLSCINCPNPIASPTVTTIYTVIGTDSNGCTNTVNVTIKVYPKPKPVITGKDSVCAGYTDTLKVKGGTTYVWSNGATTSSIGYHVVATQTVTVTAHNGMCSADTSIVIHVVSPSAKIAASADSVCQGDSVKLTGSGGTKYRWSTGKTSSIIWVNPLTTKTYTLYATAGTCSDSSIVKIKITPLVSISVKALNDTVCPHGTTTLIASGVGGKVNGYRWSTGATTSSITVNDTITTTYTATVYGICDSAKQTMKVVVIPLPKPVITGTNWKCKGVRDTLTVSSITNPTTYKWSNGKTTSSIKTGPINADSIFTVTAYNSLGCPVTIIDTIALRIPPSAIANPPAIFCAGQPITLTASAKGTNEPFVYTWSTGQTGTSITIDPGPDSATTYTVTVSNGCIGTAVTTAIPDIPILSACCIQTLTNLNDTTILWASGNSKKYQWEESPDKGTITCLNPPLCDTVRVIAPVTTTYTVIGTDSYGCQTEQLLIVDIDIPCFDLKIPNVFTPNNGGALGLNNIFYIKTENMDAWSITIYDRWGKEMYTSTNPYKYWDGNTEGGSKASDGVYYYIINATCQNTTYKKDGFVQVIR